MARALLIPNPENATIEELKQVSRVGFNETATRCTAIQMLLAGADRQLVCNALLVTNRALRKWINRFNRCGVDGLIVKTSATNFLDCQSLSWLHQQRVSDPM
jgi:hypothetical protein